MTLTGSTVGQQRQDRQQQADDHHQVEPRRLPRPDELAPLPTEVLRDRVPARQRRLQRRPEGRREHPDQHDRQPELARARPPPAAPPGRACRPGSRPAGTSTAAQPAIASDSRPPSGNPMKTFARSVARSLRRPLLLDAAGGEEEHLVRRHRGAEQRDRVVRVGGPASRGRSGAGWSPGAASCPSPGRASTARRRTRSAADPAARRPFSSLENLTRQITSHTASAASGIQSR